MTTATLDEQLSRSLEALEASEERYRTLFGSIDEGFCVIKVLFDERHKPVDYRFLESNPAFERHTGLENVVGRTARELVPDLNDFWFETYGKVALTGEAVRFEDHAPAMGRWFDVYALRFGPPEEHTVGVLFNNITARKQAAEALMRSESRFRTQADAMPQMVWVTDPEGNHLYYNRRWYEYTGQSSAESLGFGFALALHPEDMERTLELWQRAWKNGENYEIEYRFRRHDGFYRWFVGRAEPVRDPETAKITMWVGTCTDIDDLKRAQRELERLYDEERARAEREAFINQIREAARGALEPAEVLSVTVQALGNALGADRCYYVTYDQKKDIGKIGPDWYRAGDELSSIAGDYRFSDYAVNRELGYQSGQTQIVDDVHERTPDSIDTPPSSGVRLMDELGLRALIRAPLLSSGMMTALVVAMAHGPRQWKADEVRLVETVAAQTRAAVEAARVQQRERNIAQQLQDALQPPLPPTSPGIALKEFYKPALEEAGVGGDFFDVFSIEKGCTALVVGDLSGKGLAAASEVATVRNMVRYALYSGRSIAESISDLDHILVEHDLLTGFATLFVGVYDQANRTLSYVNCGQEPGLIWRAATGDVDMLTPTGAVIGGFAASVSYSEATIRLGDGDVLAVFTDGMTEIGPSRREMLEIEGLAALFARCCSEITSLPSRAASSIAAGVNSALIAGVEAYAGDAASSRDDIALLIGVAQQD
ncbi:MAG: SpoIIE family protein phosphatase [Armatimonadota bacterium]